MIHRHNLRTRRGENQCDYEQVLCQHLQVEIREIILPVEEPWSRVIRRETKRDIVVVRLRPYRHSVPSDGVRKVVRAASRSSDHIKLVLKRPSTWSHTYKR